MYNKNNTRGGGMPLILAETVRGLSFQLNNSLISRINHISLIFSEVRAILNAQNTKIDTTDNELINDVFQNIETLRNTYEPILDDDENKQAALSKRATMEKLIDLTRYNLLFLIAKHNMVDASTFKTVSGVPWGDNSE